MDFGSNSTQKLTYKERIIHVYIKRPINYLFSDMELLTHIQHNWKNEGRKPEFQLDTNDIQLKNRLWVWFRLILYPINWIMFWLFFKSKMSKEQILKFGIITLPSAVVYNIISTYLIWISLVTIFLKIYLLSALIWLIYTL